MQYENENVLATEIDTYREVQTDIWETDRRKTRNKIFWIAAIFFLSDLLALLMANAVSGLLVGTSLIIPVLFVGVGFLAYNFPMAGVISAAILFIAVIGLTIVAAGASGAFSGFMIKAVIIFFLLSAYNSAKEAEQAKRNLQSSR
jgi:hypothetical protein